jgi:hypothetical protein
LLISLQKALGIVQISRKAQNLCLLPGSHFGDHRANHHHNSDNHSVYFRNNND